MHGPNFDWSFFMLIISLIFLFEVLTNGRQLLMSTKGGRGVVIASGAERMIDIRAPYDAANILVLFGIRPACARKFVSSGR